MKTTSFSSLLCISDGIKKKSNKNFVYFRDFKYIYEESKLCYESNNEEFFMEKRNMKYLCMYFFMFGCVCSSLHAQGSQVNNGANQTVKGQPAYCPCGCGCLAHCNCGCTSGKPCTCHNNQ